MAEESKYRSNIWLPDVSALFWFLSFSLWVVLWFKNPYSAEKALNIITIPGVFMVIFCLFRSGGLNQEKANFDGVGFNIIIFSDRLVFVIFARNF